MESMFRNSLPELKVYDELILQTLTNRFPIEEKQMFLYLSGRYTKGIISARANKLHESGFYFRENGALNLLSGCSSLIYMLTENIYLAAKSYYLFKLKKTSEAIAMVDEVLRKNQFLETQGFEFLLFNNIQQYHNLARVYVAHSDYNKAFSIAQNLLILLITCKGKNFTLGYISDIDTSIEDNSKLRNLMTVQILNWLLLEIQKASLKNDISEQIACLFSNVRRKLKAFVCNNEEDIHMLRYLSVLLSFKKGSRNFERSSQLYLSLYDEIYPGANSHLKTCVELSRNKKITE